MADSPRKLTAGGIWQDMLAALRPAFWTLFAVAAPFTLLVDMVMALFGPEPPRTMAELTPRLVFLLGVLPALVGAIAQLAVAHMVVKPGEAPRTALSAAIAAWPAYVTAVLLTALPTGFAFLLFLIPGFYLMARLYLVMPLTVAERLGPTAAIRRSWELTRDVAWTVTGFLVLALLFLLGASVLVGGVGAALGSVLTLMGSKPVGQFAANLLPAVVGTVFAMANAAAAAVIYRRLTL